MKLWRHNKLDQEYELSDAEIAAGFAAYLCHPNIRVSGSSYDALREYLSSNLASTWERDDFGPLWDRISERPEVQKARDAFYARMAR